MFCPNCQAQCKASDSFCFHCGAALCVPEQSKKGTHIIPILILVGLSILGIVLFFAIPMTELPNDTPWFYIEDGVLYFDESLYTGGSELTVPERIQGQTVTGLGKDCFRNCAALTTVILPDTIETIGESAFSACSSLRGIYIPEGVTAIEPHAFANCTALEAICIPASTETIGHNAFGGCKKLSYILYNGEYSAWQSLYDQHINIKTHVYCTDGTHLHR